MRFKFLKNASVDIVGIGRNSWDRIAIVDQYPPRNAKVDVKEIDQQPGGQVATTLVAATRLGVQTKYLGKFGDDAAGRAVRGALAREGVDLSNSKVITDVPNQVAFIVVDRKHKTRNVFGYCDPRLRPTTDDFAQDAVTEGKILFLGGRNPRDMIPFARAGKEAGCLVALDADSMADGIDELLSIADVVITPEQFPTDFTHQKSIQRAIQDLAQMGPKLVCTTLGDKGCLAIFENELYESQPLDVTVADTTGAGDVFQGAFLVGLLEEMPLPRLLKFSNAAAALKCRSTGGQKGIPTREEVETLLKTST